MRIQQGAPDLTVGKPAYGTCVPAAELMRTDRQAQTPPCPVVTFLTIRQGIELVPSNIEIPQGTEATQLHGEGPKLVAAHILGQRRLYKPRVSRKRSAIALQLPAFRPSLFPRVLPTFPLPLPLPRSLGPGSAGPLLALPCPHKLPKAS